MKALYLGVCACLSLSAFSAPPDSTLGELLQKHRGSVVLVRGTEAGGSGFLAQIGKGKYLVTNQHVVAGLTNPTFTLPGGALLRTGTAAAADGHDIISFGVEGDVSAMEVMQDVDKFAVVGDSVAVLGNPDAAGVIRPIKGEIVGIGPKLVEVSAPFVAGNSGSPIIHIPSGKVIAVASYLTRKRTDYSKGRTAPEIRRFGFRLDSIKKWEPVRWWHFNDDHETVTKVAQRTKDLITVLDSISNGHVPSPVAFSDPMVKNPLATYLTQLRAVKSEREYLQNAETLMKNLQRAAAEDIDLARRRIGYSFFREQLIEEEQMRAPIANVVDLVLKSKPQN